MAQHRNLGIPYMGSKNFIATKIVEQLPAADVFVDLFAGGCAVTHAAIESGKYKYFITVDITESPSVFWKALRGEYKQERYKHWVSREEFRNTKCWATRLLWSFGNNGHTYLYGVEKEPWKHAIWQARVWGDYSELRKMGIEGDGSAYDIKQHHEEYKQKYQRFYIRNYILGDSFEEFIDTESRRDDIRHCLCNLQRLQRLESLQSLQSLQRLAHINIGSEFLKNTVWNYEGDYQWGWNMLQKQLQNKTAVIYCDPPYMGKTQYSDIEGKYINFNHEKIYQFCRENSTRDRQFFISEYDMPADFKEVFYIQHTNRMGNANHAKRDRRQEKLFTISNW